MSTNKGPCPTCGEYKNRGVSVDGVIVQEGKILLIKRGNEPYKGFWALPGGFVDWNESTEEAVAREVLEETGLSVTLCKLIGVYSKPERHPKQVINAAYSVSVSGRARAGDDAQELAWFALTDLPASLAFDHRQIIADALSQN